MEIFKTYLCDEELNSFRTGEELDNIDNEFDVELNDSGIEEEIYNNDNEFRAKIKEIYNCI